MHIFAPTPKVLYKYYPIESWLPGLIRGDAIRFSSRTSFNDPMDSRPGYRWQMETPEGVWEAKSKLAALKIPPAKKILMLSRLRNKHSKPIVFGGAEINSELDKLGILCLAERWNNLLLWAHYGEMHRGICVGFHTNVSFFQQALPMHYSQDLPVILRPIDDDYTMVKKAIFTKPLCWSYEEEWRITKRFFKSFDQIKNVANLAMGKEKSEEYVRTLSEDRGADLYPFPAEAIESITLGMRTSAEDLNAIRSFLPKVGPKPKIYKISNPSLSYSLTRVRV